MSAPQEQAKVKTPLHLRLTVEDWEECYKTLNHGELGVFMWIRASDPYGDRELEINCVQLGKRLDLHKSTVSRALQSLATKGLIDLELINTKVKQKISNRRLTLLTKEENGSNQEQEEVRETVAPAQPGLHQRNQGCTSATRVAPAQPELHQRNHDIYKERARAQTLKTFSNHSYKEEEVSKNAYEQLEPEPECNQSKLASSAEKPKKSTRQVETVHEGKSSAAAPPSKNLALAVDEWLSRAVFIQWWASRVEKTDFGAKQLEMPPVAYVRRRIRKLAFEDPASLEDMYASFQAECDRHAESYEQSVVGGITISDEHREKIEAIAPYVNRAVASPALLPASAPIEHPSGENASMYKICRAEDLPPASSPPQEFSIAALVKNKSMPLQKPSEREEYKILLDEDYLAEQKRFAQQLMEDSGNASD